MAKAPSFQFYPGDWLRDTALRICTPAARALWIDMLCIMHQAEPYGHLSVNGSVIPPVKLGVMVGMSLDELEPLLTELREAVVYRVNDAGMIYSKRMVDDHKRRETNAKNGGLGGNPKLKKSDNPSLNGSVKRGQKMKNEDEAEVGNKGKVLFANSKYAEVQTATAELGEIIAKGANIADLRTKILNWSDSKDERRTDRGWLATYRTFFDRERSFPVVTGKSQDTAQRKNLDTKF